MTNYVYTTCACDILYVDHIITKDMVRVDKQVMIKGGSGVADKRLVTPLGVSTQVSDDDLEFLMDNKMFLHAIKEGFVTVLKKKEEPEAVAKDMSRDGSSPLVPDDFAEGSKGHPIAKVKGRPRLNADS